MGNRAIVIFAGPKADPRPSPAVYLHWNGGPESVYPMLDKMVEFKVRGGDGTYASARFAQIAANFIGGILSVGLMNTPDDEARWHADLDPGDNGLYVVNWTGQLDYGVRRQLGGKWLSPKKVAAEKAEARTHPYNSKTEGETIAQMVERTSGAFFKTQDNPGDLVVTALVPR